MTETAKTHFDLIVIGGGSSGSNVATAAVEHGLRVALIERDKLGGTCLNTGCDPTKTMIRSAQVLHLARTAGRFGIDVEDARVDWPAVRERVDRVIDEIRGGDGDANVREQGISLYKHAACFVSPHEVVVNGEVLSADRFVIATGQSPVVPPIEGIEETGYLTNVDAVALDELPPSLAIVGAGPIAVEFAQMFARFGVEVTLIGPQEHVLPKEDDDLRREMAHLLAGSGVELVMKARATEARRGADGRAVVTCQRASGEATTVVADEILLATGRKPNTAGLGLRNAGVESGDRGIRVNARLATNVPHIHAVGDVTGIYPFTHVAAYQARIAVHNLLHEDAPKRADYRVVPWTIFTDPELARVGLTEAEARAGGYSVVTSTMSYRDQARAVTTDQREGLVKLVVDRATHGVLGGHILGPQAGELIGEVALAMQARLPVSAIAETIHPYPTMSEALFWAAHDMITGPLAGTTPVVAR